MINRKNPINAYAKAVLEGDIYTSTAVKRVCKRHIEDLAKQESPEFSSYFDEKRSMLPYIFAKRMLNVKCALTGKRKPLEFLGWQTFLTGMWNGWRIKKGANDHLERLPDTRRFRKLYLISGKSSGKSPLAAFFAYWMLLEQRDAEGIVFASIEEQARRIHYEMMQMQLNDFTPDRYLQKRFQFLSMAGGGHTVCRVQHVGWSSKFTVTGSGGNVQKKSSPILNFVFAEEYNALEQDLMLDVLEGGLKSSTQPLVMVLANASTKRQGPNWDLYKYSHEMLQGKVPNDDEFLPMIFEVNEKDAKAATEMKGEFYTERAKKYWPAANPSIGATIRNDSIIRLLNKGKKTEADKHDAYRLALSIWPKPGAISGWVHYNTWQRALINERPKDLEQCDLFLGLDLGSVKAFSAISKVWYRGDDGYYLEVDCYTHDNNLTDRAKNAQFDFVDASEKGLIKLTLGEKQDYGLIAQDIKDIMDKYSVRGIAVDWQYLDRLMPHFEKLGVLTNVVKTVLLPSAHGVLQIISHPQGAYAGHSGTNKVDGLNMSKSMTVFEQLILNNPPKIRIKKNALLDWMLACTEVRYVGETMNQRRCLTVDQTSYQNGMAYNDGVVAAVQAIGLAKANEPVETSVAFDASEIMKFYNKVM